MHKSIVIKLLILISTMFLTCNDNPLSWEDLLVPGRRDYVWTVDTLENIAFYNKYDCLWGTKPTSVWCVGNIGDLENNILHFNGKSWKKYDNIPKNPAIEAWSINGLDENNFWIGDWHSIIWQYKNGAFINSQSINVQEFEEGTIRKFWGKSINDFYAVGGIYKSNHSLLYGFIMKFSGKEWILENKPEIEGSFYDIKNGENENSSYYLLNWKNGIHDSIEIYEYHDRKLKLIKSCDWNQCPSMFETNGRIYFYFDKKLNKYRGTQFQIYNDLSYTDALASNIFGRSEKDFFLRTTKGIGHYNGSDLSTLIGFNWEIWILDGLIFNNDVFFLICNKNYSNFYIIRGVLKNN